MQVAAAAKRASLVVLGLVLGIALVEGALRLASSLVGPRPVAATAVGKRVILCVGDSNTYGVYYDALDSYPGQLQTLLEQRAPGRYHVLNLGLPGMNSTQIALRLPVWLDRYQPAVVVLCAGINNVWNRTDITGAPAWWERFRLARFLRILAANLREPPPLPPDTGRPEFVRTLKDGGHGGEVYREARTGAVLTEHYGDIHRHRPGDEASALLRRDLETVRAVTESRAVKLVLLAYSAFPLPDRPSTNRFSTVERMSREMRAFSRERGVPLVDPHDRFAAMLARDVPRRTLFATDDESHPNPRGYREIAELVAAILEPVPKAGALVPEPTQFMRGIH